MIVQAPFTDYAPQITNDAGTNYGSISQNFGSTNLDNIPSSGGSAGYSSAAPPLPNPVPYIQATLPSYGATGGYDTTGAGAGAAPVINSTQSGDVNAALFDKLSALFGANFQAPSQASTSGTGVVVVPEAATGNSTAAPSSASKIVVWVAVAGVAYLGYKWYKGRAA